MKIDTEIYASIREGDKVRILRKAETHELGWMNSWMGCMTKHVGEIVTVSFVGPRGIGFKESSYGYPFFVLEKISTQDDKVTVVCEGKRTTISRESAKSLNLI